MKTLITIIVLLLSIVANSQTTSTVTYYYGEFVDNYFYTVFKNGTEELRFMNPNLGEFGDGMGHIKNEYLKNKFEITYKPWKANTSYYELISIKIADKKEENLLIATFSYTEFGDFFHLVFEDDNGKEWDFGSGENNYGGFDFGEEQPNPDLVGKKFRIIWENKKVKSYDMSGENVIEIDALSIKEIKLIK